MSKDRKAARKRIRYRIRKRVIGTAERPRVAVSRSLHHLRLQAVDDASGSTVAFVSSLDPDLRKKLKGGGSNVKAAAEVGAKMAKVLKEKGLETIVFDRGGFIYHGRVKAAAEAMRKGGLTF
jgi:large subunit ribosomal protein L18